MYVGNNPVNAIDPTGHKTVFLSGWGSDQEDPRIRAFLQGLRDRGISDVSSHDYWQGLQPWGCGLICKATHFAGEWRQRTFTVSYRASSKMLDAFKKAKEKGEQANLIGYSFGGTVAANMAIHLAKRGFTVDSITLIGSPVSSKVLDEVKALGIKIIWRKNEGDKTPEVGSNTSNSVIDVVKAASDEVHHQAGAYFVGEALNQSIDTVTDAGVR